MRNLVRCAGAALVLLPGMVMGAEMECEAQVNREIERVVFSLKGGELTVSNTKADGSGMESLEVKHHSILPTMGLGGPPVSVVVAAQISRKPTGDVEFPPLVFFVHWGSLTAHRAYTAGFGEAYMYAYECEAVG